MSQIKKTHKTNIIKIKGKNVQVDKKISGLIRELNKSGLHTLSSCEQDDDGCSYIIFDYKSIVLSSIVNTPFTVLLLKWKTGKKTKLDTDSKLSQISDVIQEKPK